LKFPFPFPSLLLKNINFKIFLLFSLFISHQHFFYYFLNKKLTTIQIFFSLFHINYFNFISHQSYFLIIKKKFQKKGKGKGNFKRNQNSGTLSWHITIYWIKQMGHINYVRPTPHPSNSAQQKGKREPPYPSSSCIRS
jgi:hypothetical protein